MTSKVCKCGKGCVSAWDEKCGHCRAKFVSAAKAVCLHGVESADTAEPRKDKLALDKMQKDPLRNQHGQQ